MATQLQLRKGTTVEHSTFIGADGEVTVDTTKKTLVLHDGVTVGGFPVASKANADGTISLIKKDGASAGTINANGLFNNTLTSTNTNQALTAAQGKVLKDLADTKLTTTSAFGTAQTCQNVTSSRVSGTTYTNSTGKTIIVVITSRTDNAVNISGVVDTAVVAEAQTAKVFGGTTSISFPVPSSSRYTVTGDFSRWVEFR